MKKKIESDSKIIPLPEPKKETAFEASKRLGNKKDEKINVIDMQRAIHSGSEGGDSFEEGVFQAINRGCKQFEGDFFITVLIKKERIMHNVIRHYFIPRKSCPTPDFDQIVFKFHRKDERVEFIWVVPDKEFCMSLPLNYKDVSHDLVRFVCEFRDGTLEKKARILNKEPLEEVVT